ncbi:MAG TPA: hypothetical protein VI141_01610 [Acidimicrobiia bacterium]
MTHFPTAADVTTPWVLVIAGITPLGRRRATRAVESALNAGESVVVIDGHVPALGPDDLGRADGRRVSMYSFGIEERGGLAARLTEPDGSARRGRVWRSVGRRLGVLFRPLAVWSRAKVAIRPLADGPGPDWIVCCDEPSITTAWKASRLWPGVPVLGE